VGTRLAQFISKESILSPSALKAAKNKLIEIAKQETDIYKLEVYEKTIIAIDNYLDIAKTSLKALASEGYRDAPLVSKSKLKLLSKNAKYSKLCKLLEQAKSTWYEWLYSRQISTGISLFKDKLAGKDKTKKAEFIDWLYGIGLVDQWFKGDKRNPKIVKELLKKAKGKGVGDHSPLIDKVKGSRYFVAAEIPLEITVNGKKYAGQIDYLLFDGKRFYIADFKPRYSISDKGFWSFVNTIPQVSVYAKVLQQITGIETQCIVFNEGGAITFDPNKILDPINNFMQDGNEAWVPPWVDFCN
jgi:hypothetical protein